MVWMAAPPPELSMVRVLAPVTTNELALVKLSEPRDSLASRMTVRRVEPTPRVAVSPAALGTLGLLLHLVASDQLPSEFTFQAPTVPVAGTVIVPEVLAVAVPITAWMLALPEICAVNVA